jgi:hypothetical protein
MEMFLLFIWTQSSWTKLIVLYFFPFCLIDIKEFVVAACIFLFWFQLFHFWSFVFKLKSWIIDQFFWFFKLLATTMKSLSFKIIPSGWIKLIAICWFSLFLVNFKKYSNCWLSLFLFLFFEIWVKDCCFHAENINTCQFF